MAPNKAIGSNKEPISARMSVFLWHSAIMMD